MIEKLKLKEMHFYTKSIIIGSLLSLFFWIEESMVHLYIFGSKSIVAAFIPHDKNELWMRFVISILFFIIAFGYDFILNQKIIFSKQVKLAYKTLEQMNESCVITSQNNEIIYVNKHFETMTGYSLSEVKGKNPNILSSGIHDSDFYKNMWNSLNNNHYWEGEVWNRHRSGEIYTEWISINVIELDNLKYFVGIAKDITIRKKHEERMLYYAYNDILTDLPNRRSFTEALNQAIKVAARNKQKLAVLFVDLDNFKLVNDKHGHVVGDQYLCTVSDILKRTLRKSDVISRFGGDEFVILLSTVNSKEGAAEAANKLLSKLMSTTVVINNIHFSISASIGGAIYPDDTTKPDELIQLADETMYIVKKSGRGNVLFYRP